MYSCQNQEVKFYYVWFLSSVILIPPNLAQVCVTETLTCMLLFNVALPASSPLTRTKSIMADKVENWTCEQLGKLGIDATIDIAR